ncbi:hypothetical protein GCM10020219_063890 [Nonomuraea dietziae]
MNRLVVVGYGPTAHRLVETLLSRGFDGHVTVFGEEPLPAYDRVALTSYLQGVTLEELEYPELPGVVTRLSSRVTGIDRAAKVVTTEDGHAEPYDTLVLATGSAPFVPPVPGASGAFVYRTIDDLERIRQAASGAARGVVVGGGLLGLEAADALRGLGLDTHIVELSPWLMPRQVDEGGGSVLKGHISNLGLSVHAGVSLASIEPDRVVLSDGGVIDASVVVFSAGIKPRDELARDCGLEVGARGGIVVDEGMRTADPSIYAVGECALVGGMVYGLVGPCFTQAEVAVDRMLGGSAAFHGADMSAKLKLLGVEVAQFGAMEGALDVTYMDPVGGVYKKLFISDDARTLLGGICVGDARAHADPAKQRPRVVGDEQLLVDAAHGVHVGDVERALHRAELSHLDTEQLELGRHVRAVEGGRAAEHPVDGHLGLGEAGADQAVDHAADQRALAHRVDRGVGGAHALVDDDPAARADLEAAVPGQLVAGLDAGREDDHGGVRSRRRR